MFSSSRPLLALDYLRVPYSARSTVEQPADGLVHLYRSGTSDAVLLWPDFRAAQAPLAAARGAFSVAGIPIFGRVAAERELVDRAPGRRSGWLATEPVLDERGTAVAHVLRNGEGQTLLPFDPDELIEAYWSEAYHDVRSASVSRRVRAAALRSYYRVRPLLPRSAQIRLRQGFARVQSRARFPRWPVEPALHDFYDLLLSWLGEAAREPVPWIAPWPAGRSWALVLTHDVETEAGYAALDRLLVPERALGLRSSCNFAGRRYRVEDDRVAALLAEGFEVGVHGLYHDGRDLESLETLRRRLPEMRQLAERWSAVGFRAPATHRVWEWMPALGFEWDSSYPDTDPYEPQPGGCCSWLPFLNGRLVELPVTLPQDHTLFVILRRADERDWVEKTRFLQARGGMALLITHPDYLHDSAGVGLYERFLRAVADDDGVWQALPREVAGWWRRRDASRIEQQDGDWTIVGPAAEEARILFAGAEAEKPRNELAV